MAMRVKNAVKPTKSPTDMGRDGWRREVPPYPD